jgi:hypothetical protein
MSKSKSGASGLFQRFRQSDVEETGSESLYGKAFRQRLLDSETEAPIVSGLPRNAPRRIANYDDDGGGFLRKLLRVALVFVLPALAIGLIVWIVMGVLSQNAVSPPLEVESQVFDNIPVPAGARPIPRAAKYSQLQIAESYYGSNFPAYTLIEHKGAASYITAKPRPELLTYYKTKLVDSKLWQQFGNFPDGGEKTIRFHIKQLRYGNVANALEVVMITLENVSGEILKRDPDYYDRQAKPGDSVIVITKSWLRPR